MVAYVACYMHGKFVDWIMSEDYRSKVEISWTKGGVDYFERSQYELKVQSLHKSHPHATHLSW
jgi:hypothetical protein